MYSKGRGHMKRIPTPIEGVYRKSALKVPEAIYRCSGIMVFGKRIKSLVFSTDLAVIKNVNADAIIAVYPFTPQPVITQALLTAADVPVFVGVGGGLTKGNRMAHMAAFAEMQGAMGVVANHPTSLEHLHTVSRTVYIPLIATVVRSDTDFAARVEAGVSIFNVSAAADTPAIVAEIRKIYPDMPIIATGGPTDESISATIEAGANAITWTPPSCAEIFRGIMERYRQGLPYEEDG